MTDLNEAQQLALVNVPPGIYRHYQGSLYVVLGLARRDDTGDVFVVYRSRQSYDAEIAGEGVLLRVRPVDEWYSRIPTGDGGTVPRFRRVVE